MGSGKNALRKNVHGMWVQEGVLTAAKVQKLLGTCASRPYAQPVLDVPCYIDPDLPLVRAAKSRDCCGGRGEGRSGRGADLACRRGRSAVVHFIRSVSMVVLPSHDRHASPRGPYVQRRRITLEVI